MLAERRICNWLAPRKKERLSLAVSSSQAGCEPALRRQNENRCGTLFSRCTSPVNAWHSVLTVRVFAVLLSPSDEIEPAAHSTFAPHAPITVEVLATDSDGQISKVELYADGVWLGERQSAPFIFIVTNLAPASYALVARAHDNEFGATESEAVPIHVLTPEPATLIGSNAVWRYLNNGSDPGTNWRLAGFADSAWPAGPAQLGLGDGDEVTVLTNRPVTTYFRHTFVRAHVTNYLSLTASLLRDDGAVVYLNDVEIFRSNMPGDAVNYLTQATSAVSGAGENTFYPTPVSPAHLLDGTNVVAVELHQSSANNTDASFVLSLTATYVNPDADGDGLPDAWELANGLDSGVNDANLDADEDGLTNHEEFLAGTDPQDDASALRLQSSSAAAGCCPVLAWTAMAGRSYTVRRSDTLDPFNWIQFTNVAAVPTNRLMQIPIAEWPGAQGDFQLVTPALP